MRVPFGALMAALLSTAVQAQAPVPLTFDDLVRLARPTPTQYRAEAFLATQRRGLAATSGFLRDGPSLLLSAGPRRNDVGSSTDRSVELDLPLFLARSTRRRLQAAFGEADPLIREAAKLQARSELRSAYLDAWLQERLLALREADLATAQAWLKAATARVAAGSDPALQADLVRGEILKAQLALDRARASRGETWGRLQALAEVAATPQPLADPGPAVAPPVNGLVERFEKGAFRRALQGRQAVEEAAVRQRQALDTSRWSLRGGYAEEGRDRLVRFGVAYRIPRTAESQALRAETEAASQASRRELEVALAELDARFQSDLERLPSFSGVDAQGDFASGLRAAGLRLAEGKERPSEALPIRRQLLEAQEATLRRIHDAHLLLSELALLADGAQP